jgi:hypothetical protein
MRMWIWFVCDTLKCKCVVQSTAVNLRIPQNPANCQLLKKNCSIQRLVYSDGSEHGLIRRRTRVSCRYPLFCRRACVFLLRFSIFLNFPRYSVSTRVPFALLLVFLILSRHFVSMHIIFSFIFLYSFVTSSLKSADRRVFFAILSDKCTTQFTVCACRILYFN